MDQTYTDPPDMLDDERMTAAELRVVREYLGVTGDWLGHRLGVGDRTWRRWEAGTHPIPDGVRLQIEQIEHATAEAVAAAVEACRNAREPIMLTYRSDEEYRAHHPEAAWPASWHRAVVARVAQEVPGLAIDYWTPGRVSGAHRPQVGDRVPGVVSR